MMVDDLFIILLMNINSCNFVIYPFLGISEGSSVINVVTSRSALTFSLF